MSLTASEEALVRQLLDQQAALLSLAGNEATITSKLGANKVTLSDLAAAVSVADADLLLTRQGVNDRSLTASLLAQYISAELGVTAPQFDNDTSLATTAFVRSEILGQGNAVYDAIFGKSLTDSGYQKLPSGLIIQWGTASVTSTASGATTNVTITCPIAFPNAELSAAVCVGAAPIGTEFFTVSAARSGLTQLIIKCRNSFGGIASTALVDWLIIGY